MSLLPSVYPRGPDRALTLMQHGGCSLLTHGFLHHFHSYIRVYFLQVWINYVGKLSLVCQLTKIKSFLSTAA